MVDTAGKALRHIRMGLGFTLTDVSEASERLAEAKKNPAYSVSPSRLSEIEAKNVLPTIYRFYTLSVVYRVEFGALLRLYGLDIEEGLEDSVGASEPPKTHMLRLPPIKDVHLPTDLLPILEEDKTTHFSRLVERWGILPFSCFRRFSNANYSYGYIGSQDRTMAPLLPPGSFVQIDESRTEIQPGFYASEYERPIYFVETRTGYVCCWCSIAGNTLTLTPHPRSPVLPVTLRYPYEADIVGQVVGAAVGLRPDVTSPA